MSIKKPPKGVIIRNQGTDSATWFLDKQINGKRFKKSSRLYRRDFLNKSSWWKANEEWYAHTLEAIRRIEVYGERPEWTFLQASELYLQDNKGRLRNVTYFVSDLSFVNEYCGGVPLKELSRDHSSVRSLVTALRGRGAKNKTINNYLEVLRRILNYSATRKDDNGMTLLGSAPKIPMLTLEDQRRPRVLKWSEQELLIERLNPAYREMCTFMLNTGLRQAELTGATLGDLREFQGMHLLLIHRKKHKVGAPKFPVMLNEVALTSLGRSIASTRLSGRQLEATTPLFTHNGEAYKGKLTNYSWKRYVQGKIGNDGLGWDLRIHDLRHTFGHRLKEVGCPLETRKVMLGHMSGDITEHYSQESLQGLHQWASLVAQPRDDVMTYLELE